MHDFNGFRLGFSAPTFTAYQQPMPDNKHLRPLKEQLGTGWFLYCGSRHHFGKSVRYAGSIGNEPYLLVDGQ